MDYKSIPNPNNIPAEKRVYLSPTPKTVHVWCGHKLDPARFPKKNCNQCWTYYLMANRAFTQLIGQRFLQPNGEQILTNEYGSKAVKKFKWFFAQIAKAQEIAEQLEPQLATEEMENLVDADFNVEMGPLNNNLNPALDAVLEANEVSVQ